jgi:alpha-tubulin suppressor-like RCC1 family protein
MAKSNLLVAAAGALCALALLNCNDTSIVRGSSGTSSGNGASGVASLSQPSIDFGQADCGGMTPAPKPLTLTNTGDTPLRWSAALDDNSYFDVAGAKSGTIDPGGTATLSIVAQSMPSKVTAGTVKNATLTFTTSDPQQPQVYVPLRAVARGATLELVVPDVADFGEAPVGQDAPEIAFTVKNVGNVAAQITITAPADPQFTFSWTGSPAAAAVAPGATMPGLAAHFKASHAKQSSSAGLVAVTGPVCGESAQVLSVKGKGLGGAVGISPGTANFGKVDCNSQAKPVPLVLYNTGNQPYVWTAALKDGKNFTLSAQGGAVVAGGSATLTVIPKAIGMTTNLAADGFSDTLTISTDVTGDMPHAIPVKETANGAILTWDTTTLTYGTQDLFSPSAGKSLDIKNDGNADAVVKLKTSAAYVATPASGTAPSAGKLTTQIAFAPDNFGTVKGTIDLTTDSAICQPLPATVPAVGDGGKGQAVAISVGGYGMVQRNAPASSGGCAILANSGGRVACWGSNEYGQLGTKVSVNGYNVLSELKDVVSVAAGGDFNCAADKNGDVWCWGNNQNGQEQVVGKLGQTGDKTTSVPTKVIGVTGAVQVAIGHNAACALTNAGVVACWGDDRRGQVTGSNGSFLSFAQQVSNVAGATSVSMNGGGGCALLADMTVRCWGYNERGQLGNGSTGGAQQAVTVSNLSDATAIANITSGPRNGGRFALRSDGTVMAWGHRAKGQMGNGEDCRRCSQATPSQVNNVSGATAIAGTYAGGCALINDGTVMCWGQNKFGQVGDGSTQIRTNPVFVSGLSDATAIAGGGRSACAIVTGGGVKCWGYFGVGSSVTPFALKYFGS